MKKTYTVDELFEDIPGDPENVMMNIPPEVLEETGWKEGDTLNISLENETIVIKKL
jgi:hypothetical protein